jgi:two-component system cell cycle response regulator
MTAPVGPHVVVADDDPRALRVLSWALREQGYEVSPVADAATTVEAIQGRHADLILLSSRDGDAVEETLRSVRSLEDADAVPVIVAGGERTPERVAALRIAAEDWLPAPLHVGDLLSRVAAVMRARNEVRALREQLRRKDEELHRAAEDVATVRQLVEILNEVTGELTASEIYRVLARRVARALDLRHCSVILASAGDQTGTVVACYEDPSVTDLQVQIARYPELAAALQSSRPVLVADVSRDELFADVREMWRREGHAVPIRSVLAIPFALDRRRAGVFFLRTERGDRTLTQEDADFAETVIRAAVAAARRAHVLESTREDNRRLEQLATTDALTRLLNRRALLERLSVEVDRARRFHSQLSLLMLDLDHFKDINDQFGHLNGDHILRQLGTLLAGVVRTIDVCARYGGEEFVLLLPETATDGATVFAERLRECISEHEFEREDGARNHLTCSIGVATFPSPRVNSTEDLFARADEALYRAKSGGRNQVRT